MTQEKFLEWLQHFINTVRPSVENKVLLILDGHSSHTGSLAAIDLARENGVVMLCLPPHTTNKLQPLDISFFRPLKTRFLQAQETWLRNNPGQKVSAFQIAHLFNSAYSKAASISNAVSGFEKTGIFPCNRQVFADEDFAPSTLVSNTPAADECADREQCNPCSSQQPSTSRQGSSSGRTGQHPSAATNSSRLQYTAESAHVSAGHDHVELDSDTDTENEPVRGKRPRREKQNESDIPVLTDSESDAEETLYSVIRTNPDGRCFFRSVCIGLDKRLQRAERDENGFVTDPVLKVQEQLAADELRAKTVNYVCEHVDEYNDMQADALNADMPTGVRFTSIMDRISAMATPTTPVGELEISCTAHVLQRPISVCYGRTGRVFVYQTEFAGANTDPVKVIYRSFGDNAGHYDCLVQDATSHDDETPEESAETESENNPSAYVSVSEISPLPTLRPGPKRGKTAEILTSTPYKQTLLGKKKPANKTRGRGASRGRGRGRALFQ
ncbi:hypothetical protein BaRGS_00028389 [Batillaria attramentaria]|uniref:Ubiquitin thioesterase OTU n=1 Tax=Batillaria attramentaria TaxID=370345 RepID=A0ABD0JZV5_9CAEN